MPTPEEKEATAPTEGAIPNTVGGEVARIVEYRRKRNEFRQVLTQAMNSYPERISRLNRIRVRVATSRRNQDLQDVVEEQIVAMAVAAGVIPVGAVGDDGMLVGNWMDWLSVLIDRLPEIFKMIADLISIFSLL